MASSAKRLLIPQKTSQSLQEINRLRAAAGVRPAGQDWSRYVRMISSLMRKQAMGETPRHKSKPKGGAMAPHRLEGHARSERARRRARDPARSKRTDEDRLPHRENRPARLRRHPDGA